MTIQALKFWLTKQPFQPFQLVLSSGDRYRVDHPENCMLLKDRIVVAFSTSPKDELPDDMALLSYLHIAAAEPVNGKSKKKK